MMPASSHLISKNIKKLSSKLKNKLQTGVSGFGQKPTIQAVCVGKVIKKTTKRPVSIFLSSLSLVHEALICQDKELAEGLIYLLVQRAALPFS